MSDIRKVAAPLDWKSVATWQHLFAATMAAHDLKLKYNEIARYMSLDGPATTYDAVEGRFRKIRKEAEKLQARSGELPDVAVRGSGKKKATGTPRNSQVSSNGGSQGVISGRIKKSTSTKPKKLTKATGNMLESMDPDTGYGTGSTDQDHSTTGFDVDVDGFNYTAELNSYDGHVDGVSDEGYDTYDAYGIKQEM